jgi:hypothetical protein
MGLIARQDDFGQVPPNNPPAWTNQPTISFVAGVGGTYDLTNNVFDPEGDTLTFSLNAASAALSSSSPEDVTLSSAGIITATSSVTAGDRTGIIIDVSDGTNDPVPSSSFSIAITVQSSNYPELWDDYGDKFWAGEAGGLAVNDNHASAIYTYIPQFAPTIPTLPKPTDTPSALPTSSAVNPNASDEYIVYDRAGLVTALASASYTYIFVAKGEDITDGADADSITVTNGGTVGTPRWVIYFDPADLDAVDTVAPWNDTQANRVNMPKLIFSGSSAKYWYVVGISTGRLDTNQKTDASYFTSSANNITYYRCNHENAQNHCHNMDATSSYITIYQCTIHNNNHQYLTTDQHGVKMDGANQKVINCEFWNNAGDGVQEERGTGTDCIIEDCDFYETVFLNASGQTDSNPNDRQNYIFSYGQGAIETKKASDTKIYGNRAFYMRDKYAGDNWSGSVWALSTPADSKFRRDCRWNIVHDSSIGNFDYGNGRNEDTTNPSVTGGGHSIVRNICYDVWDTNTNVNVYLPISECEVYLNTFVDCVDNLWQNYRFDSSDIANVDVMGNWFQNTGNIINQGNWGTTWKFGYNAYSGSYTTANNVYPVGYEQATPANLNMGDFKYYRKKLTGPEVATIPGIVPTSSTPVAFRTLVPIIGGVDEDRLGSRTGIGVDDNY